MIETNKVTPPEIKSGKFSSNQILIFSLLIFVFFFLLSLSKISSFTLDETVFHYPNVLNFYENGVGAIFNTKYSAANTPLPYIIIAVIAKVTGPSLLLARIVTGIVSLFAFFFATRLLKALGSSNYSFFVILFFPYFFVNSFIFYAVNYGLFFATIALLIYYHKKEQFSYKSNFIVGLFLSCAVLCQQFYLMVPIAIMITEFFMAFRQKSDNRVQLFKRMVISYILLGLPLIVPFLLFFKWGGLTHPNFREFTLAFYPSTLVAILFVSGFNYMPYLLQSIRQINKWEISIASLLSIILVLLFRPTFISYGQGAGLFTGLTYHLITISEKIHPSISAFLMMGLVCSGILIFIKLFKSISSGFDYILSASSLLFILAYLTFTQIGERHLLPLSMIIFFLILPRIRNSYAKLYMIFMATIGIGYYFYWNYFKFT